MVLSQSAPKGGIRGTPYVSCTLDLQLACLDLCRVCRSFSSLHVRLEEKSVNRWGNSAPESLWVAPDNDDDPFYVAAKVWWASLGGGKSGDQVPSRVPPVFPFSVYCRPSNRVLCNRTTKLWTRLERLLLVFDLASDPSSRRVALPRTLKQLSMTGNADLPAALVSSLSSGGSMSLLKLYVDGNFDQPLREVVWPAGLVQISFGPRFCQRLGGGDHGVKWPASLRQLSFKRFPTGESFAKIRWPASIERLVFFDGGFDGPIQGAAWPSSLRKLVLGNDFNQPIAGVVWPPSLQQLLFGLRFDQDIKGVVWPASLRKLSFGIDSTRPNIDNCRRIDPTMEGNNQISRKNSFNRPMAGVVLPFSLRQLSFGNSFDKPIIGFEWPASLQQISFGYSFNQPLAGVVWPASLQELSFGCRFDHSIVGVVWPNSLESLKFGEGFVDQSITEVVWPAYLQHLSLPRHYDRQTLKGITWPASLKTLFVGAASVLF